MPPGRGSRVASTPVHRIICSGSTKNLNTTSGGASIRTSRSTGRRSLSTATPAPCGRSPMVRLGRRLEAREPFAPEVVEEGAQLGEPLRTDSIQAPRAIPTLGEEARVLQHAEMLRDRGAGHVEV